MKGMFDNTRPWKSGWYETAMYRRPESVAAIGYLLVIGGCLELLHTLFNLTGSDLPSYFPGRPSALSISLGGISASIGLIAGLNILRGQNWARWLYAGMCVALLAFDLTYLLDNFYMLVPATVIRAIIIIFLFLPGANKYFRGGTRW